MNSVVVVAFYWNV